MCASTWSPPAISTTSSKGESDVGATVDANITGRSLTGPALLALGWRTGPSVFGGRRFDDLTDRCHHDGRKAAAFGMHRTCPRCGPPSGVWAHPISPGATALANRPTSAHLIGCNTPRAPHKPGSETSAVRSTSGEVCGLRPTEGHHIITAYRGQEFNAARESGSVLYM